MRLQCKNPECDSRIDEGQEPLFTVNLTVDSSGSACESARKIDGDYFTCCFCQDTAEWIEED
jgi:hypothetical protein